MHLGRFHRVIELLNTEFKNINPHGLLQDIVGNLNAVSANPGNLEIAGNFKQSLEKCRQALAQSPLNRPRPITESMLQSIGADEFIGDRLFRRVMAAIESNPGAPALSVQLLTKLQEKTQQFFKTVAALDTAFTNLQVEYDDLEPGEAEVGLIIPKNDNASTLQDLAKEFKEWHIALMPIVEVFDPEASPLQIKVCSTTDWTLYLAATPAILTGVSYCLKRVNEILREALEMRNLLEQLVKRNASPAAVEQLEEENNKKLEVDLKKFAEEVVDERLRNAEEGRKNELKIHLAISLKTLAHKVTTGAKVEVRLLPPIIEEAEGGEGVGDKANEAHENSDLQELANKLDREVDLLSFDDDVKTLQVLLSPPAEPAGE